MKNLMKQELINDVLTGLLVAATFAAVIPGNALADVASTVTAARTSIMQPATTAVSYVAYLLGTVMVVSGIAHAKKHSDNPSQNALGPAVGKMLAGAAFLAAPSVVGALYQTGQNTTGGSSGTFNPISGF